jgi:deoxyribonuclease-4
MKRIGPHVSTSGGVQNAPVNASVLGATAFGLFTKNQRQWIAKPYEKSTIDSFKKNCADKNYNPDFILAHDSYLINIGNADPDKRKQSREALIDELERCEQLGLKLLNMHPGSHLGVISESECLDLIAESINIAHSKTESAIVVLENTAGQGSNMGYDFVHLAHIIDKVENKSRIGVCLDTCHTFAAGYDLRTKETYADTMKQFDSNVGFKYLMGMHLNDSKGKHGSKLDRHHSIGQGELGLEPFRFIMNDPHLEEIPMVLETIDETLWENEIKLLYSMVEK